MVVIDVICHLCNRTSIKLENIDFSGMSEGERWDALEKLLPRDWAFRADPAGKRFAVCPLCVHREHDAQNFLPYSGKGRCAKCGHRRISTLYLGGLRYDLYTRPEHEFMERKCARCGYVWLECPLVASHQRTRRWWGVFLGLWPFRTIPNRRTP